MHNRRYTIEIETENHTDMISRLAILFSRRRISIDYFNLNTSVEQSSRFFTIRVNESEETMRKLHLQIVKQVDVLQSRYYDADLG